MNQFLYHADKLYRSFFGKETDALYKKIFESVPSPIEEIPKREGMKVPSDCVTAPDAIVERWVRNAIAPLHHPLPMGEPAPWRSAAAAWEQIGDYDPADVMNPNHNRRSNTKRDKPPSKRTLPIEGIVQSRNNDALKLRGSISETAFAVATVVGCRFPIGDPKLHGFHFCDAPRTHGSYCDIHKQIVARDD